MVYRLPDPILDDPSTNSFRLKHLIAMDQTFSTTERAQDPREKLFGYVVPNFQRPPVWTLEQQTKLIESIWLGLPIGTYIVNRLTHNTRNTYHPLNDIIIDGQQRLRAIKAYWDDEFPVFGFLWSELDREEKHRFEMSGFSQIETRLDTEEKVRDTYNRLAYGGTAHTEEQRA